MKQKALIRFTSSGLIRRAAGQVGWMYIIQEQIVNFMW